MEQTPQPRGDQNEITTHDQPVVYDGSAAEAPPPLTFGEAEQHSAFQLLTELHDHALSVMPHERTAEFHLTELALSAAVVAWWSRWQPLAMHRAFRSGASLAEVAAAAGTTETEAYGRWTAWAERQASVTVEGRTLLNPVEVDAVRTRIAPGVAPPSPS